MTSESTTFSELDARLQATRPKRILALDGGGVKGILTAGMLEVLEQTLRDRQPPEVRESFRLSDYFDLVGGTSTGAIIAAWIALGHTASELTALYREVCPEVFGKKNFVPGIQSKFDPSGLERAVEERLDSFAQDNAHIIGKTDANHKDITLDSPLFRTGFAAFAKRVDTGSPWILTNNPRSKYWDKDLAPWKSHWTDYYQKYPNEEPFFPNREYKLADVVRASASAPFYLSAVEIPVEPGKDPALFLDGAVTPHNNPSLYLFLATALSKHDGNGAGDERRGPFGFNWATGPDNLFMLSLGTGTVRPRITPREYKAKLFSGRKAIHAMTTLIYDTSMLSTLILQGLSEPQYPISINSEVEDMRGVRLTQNSLLSYARIDPELTPSWLDGNLGVDLPGRPEKGWHNAKTVTKRLNELDCPQATNLDRLHAIGRATAEKFLDASILPE